MLPAKRRPGAQIVGSHEAIHDKIKSSLTETLALEESRKKYNSEAVPGYCIAFLKQRTTLATTWIGQVSGLEASLHLCSVAIGSEECNAAKHTEVLFLKIEFKMKTKAVLLAPLHYDIHRER